MYTFHYDTLKNAFDTSQDNFVVIGIRSYSVSSSGRTLTTNLSDIPPTRIEQGSFSIESSVTSDKFYFAGGCMASELKFTLMNYDNTYKIQNFKPKGYEAYVYMGNYNALPEIPSNEKLDERIFVVDSIDEAKEKITSLYTSSVSGTKTIHAVLNADDGTVYKKGMVVSASKISQNSSVAIAIVGELLPMGIFIIDSAEYIAQGRRVKIKALDRMSLLDETFDLKFSTLSTSDNNNSGCYKSMQFARVMEFLRMKLYGVNFSSTAFTRCTRNLLSPYAPLFSKVPWGWVQLFCDEANKGNNCHALGELLFIYDNDYDYAMVPTSDTSSQYYATFSSSSNYLPAEKNNTTYRTVLQSLCQLVGCNAWFNRMGLLEFDWISSAMYRSDYRTGTTGWVKRQDTLSVNNTKCKDLNLLTPKFIRMSGVKYYAGESDSSVMTEYKYKTGNGYMLDISNNCLIGKTYDGYHSTTDMSTALGYQGNFLARFFYRNRLHTTNVASYATFDYQPFECDYANTPYIDLCDGISASYVDPSGATRTFSSYITDITYNTNIFMKLKARGEEVEN